MDKAVDTTVVDKVVVTAVVAKVVMAVDREDMAVANPVVVSLLFFSHPPQKCSHASIIC